ncbi:MAG TPA: long-chain fatty acid--CoA ligase [Thermoanaerobaculia bacterium]
MPQSKVSSVVHLLEHRVAEAPEREALSGRRDGAWYSMTWAELARQVRAVACGLHGLGLGKGERAAILAATRPEWVVADLGILSAGGATTTLYPSNTADECRYILADSGARVCFAENALQVEKLVEVRGELPALATVVQIDGEPDAGGGWVIPLAELVRRGEAWDRKNPGAYEATAEALRPDDLATLIYTSGTTGPPKGVMLTHDNWLFEGETASALGLVGSDDRQLLFLPLAHSFGKALELVFLQTGMPTAFDGNIDDLLANLAAVRPTFMAAVPRVFEKVYNRVVSGAREGGALKYKIFQWALGVGRRVSRERQAGREPQGLLALQATVADKLVFSKLKERFGGRIRFLLSGGAPLARAIGEFFHAAGILVLDAYGLTETSAGSTGNRPESYRFGSVGQPFPGVEVKIADDGEILLRGRNVMRGYYNQPQATAEALDPDGFLHTGDVGELDRDGFLIITDRKKDILVTAGGKNVAPQNVENLLKAHCPYVSQVVMLGDRRPFCVALVTIHEEATGRWAKEHGLAFASYAELAALPAVHTLITTAVDEVNAKLASYERIRKIRLLDHDLSQETGELTPKMSVKRRVVETRHRDVLELLYGETVEQL